MHAVLKSRFDKAIDQWREDFEGVKVYSFKNGPFVHGGLFCPGGQLLPHRIITDNSCIKCFNDIVGKFVPNRIIQSDSVKAEKDSFINYLLNLYPI